MSNDIERLQNLCKYFKECYQEDNKTAIIDNIFEKKIEEKYFFNEEQLLSGKKLIVKNNKLALLKGKAYLYRKEKELLYGSTIITGKVKSTENSKDLKVCAPLLFFPLTINETKRVDTVELSVNPGAVKVNFGLISLLYPEIVAIEKNDRLEEIIAKANYTFSRKILFRLLHSLESEEVTFDTELITLFPLTLGEASVKKEFSKTGKNPPNTMTALNSGFITLVKKSKGTRGIIEEADHMGTLSDFSPPMFSLFGKPDEQESYQKRAKKSGKMGRMFHPLLSNSQQSILDSSRKNPVTLVIGPPGTGKSYTIASIALDHYFRGESVLIASRMDQAVEVIRKKIKDQIGSEDGVIRGGGGEYLRALKKRLDHILKTVQVKEEPKKLEKEQNLLLKNLKKIDIIISRLQKNYNQAVKKEIKRGDFLNKESFFLYKNIMSYMIEKAVKNEVDLFTLTNHLEKRIKNKVELTSELAQKRYIHELNSNFWRYGKDSLRDFLKAIRARTDGKQEKIFSKTYFSDIFDIFPIWLVTSPGIYHILPLQKELFDVVIIDEATQCDVTSCLPLLQRAKRAVIVGDPNQLAHVSFVSKQKQYFIGKKYNLSDEDLETYNYREKSILHTTSESMPGGENSFFLDEHFRSLPGIISFSNQNIYNNSLKIMTESPGNNIKNVIEVIQCKGTRTASGYNREEAEAIVKELEKIINEDLHLDQNSCRSIGILSPFRKQVDYIHSRLIKSFSLTALEKHDILAGTAHTFQGEERDIMLLSLVIDKKTHKNSHYFISKEDVLNVSITRARVLQKVFVSLTPADLSDKMLVRDYLEYIDSFSKQEQQKPYAPGTAETSQDSFLCEVMEELAPYEDVLKYPAYSIAGLTIDLVVDFNNKAFGIDLIGYPGEFVESFSLERYKMYYRAGLKIIPLTYSSWYFDKKKCIQEILNQIDYKKD